ncbi:hypothetical protein C0992_011369, partial [Termitomyces sp. T32_za158]
MIREWRYLKMLKRSARGHEKDGILTTKPGSCAVQCPACPHPDMNMPDNWRDAPEDKRWLHALFIGIDANFCLKRKDVSSDTVNPDLGNGFAYFVQEKQYKQHLERHKDEVEPKSNCSRHNAINLANSKLNHGLAATGVGTIECVRHDMKRPCSVGDLQFGELYCDMDYLFYHSVSKTDLNCYVIAYDVACQWSIYLKKRMFELDHDFLMFDDRIHIRFFVPKFHLTAHVAACQTEFSFNYGLGVGRTDDEAPERGWAEINPIASNTKEMGPGSHWDALDSHFGDYNWRKVIGMAPTQAAVRHRLAEAESNNAGTIKDSSLDKSVSPSVLIACGMDIEAEQRALKVEASKIWTHSQDRQRTKLQLQCNALQRKITAWSKIHQLYIPNVVTLSHAEEQAAAAQNMTLKPYTLSLWLPSHIGVKAVFDLHLATLEWQLRVAQAHEALDALR